MITIPIEDRLAIMELSSLYSICCDTHQFDRLAELFTEDCIYDESCVGVERAQNKADLLRIFDHFASSLGPVMHTCSNHIISRYLDDTAVGMCYVWAEGLMNQAAGSLPIRTTGYYDDVYVKQNGRWLFKERVLHCLLPSQGVATIGGIRYEAQNKHLVTRN